MRSLVSLQASFISGSKPNYVLRIAFEAARHQVQARYDATTEKFVNSVLQNGN